MYQKRLNEKNKIKDRSQLLKKITKHGIIFFDSQFYYIITMETIKSKHLQVP